MLNRDPYRSNPYRSNPTLNERKGRRPSRRGLRDARRSGFLEMDILAGLVIVGALTMALAGVLGRQHRAVQKLADTRAAMQVAEAVLTDLQSGRSGPAPGAAADTSVEVRPAVPADSGERAGKWVEVVVSVRAGHASLVGALPASAAVTPAPKRGDAR